MTGPIFSGDPLYPARLNRPTSYSIFSTSSQTGVTSEVVSLTATGVTFKSGWAYEAHFRAAVYGTAALQAMFRIRKTNVAGADWGEYGRVRCEGISAGTSAMANGALVLLRSAGTDLTSVDVALTVAGSGSISVFANAASPRYLVIRPVGFASEYTGCGVEVA